MTYLGLICVVITTLTPFVSTMTLETARSICPAMNKLAQPIKWNDESKLNIHKVKAGMSDMLWKANQMHDYHNYFDQNSNFCSMYHYGPGCRGSQCVEMPTVDDNGHTSCFTYNANTGNTVRMQLESEKTDTVYAILTNSVTKVEFIDTRTGHAVTTPVTEIPRTVKSAFENFFTYVAIQPQGYWYILQSCDEQITWVRVLVPFVAYNEDTQVIEELLNLRTMEDEVNRKLQELGINWSNLVNVPLISPFPQPTTSQNFSSQPMTSPFLRPGPVTGQDLQNLMSFT